MPDVIFAKPRWDYQTYSDFWRLVEVSGYPIIYMDEIDAQSDNVYFFSTPDTRWHDGTGQVGWKDAKARIIYYNIEWYLDVDYHSIPGVEVWSTDKWHAEQVGVRYVPMGSHPNLNPYPDADIPKRYDVITLFAPSYRRYCAYDYLQRNNISLAPDGWGDERHIALLQSRAMLMVHQHDHAFCIAPQRWALAAAYHLPVITETLSDGGIFGKSYRIMSDLIHIGDTTALWLRKENEARLADFGRALHNLLCIERTFRKGIEAAL